MGDKIKCTCSNCGAKYRLPVEAQGRTARCKRCGQKFRVPQVQSLEDTVMSWLAIEDDNEDVIEPKVVNMTASGDGQASSETVKRARGPIRLKDDSEHSDEATTKSG